MKTVAALYVESNGSYAGLDGVEVWDEERDARTYAGPHPVIAHPPCARWGRYWSGGPSATYRRELGDDGGCFASALEMVRRFSGVLEHPEASHAWRWFGLIPPNRSGGWTVADWLGGWSCCVEQGHYGHRARKATWLYAVGVNLRSLEWEPSEAKIKIYPGFHSTEERRRATKTGAVQRMCKKERTATPKPFRDLLLSMARSAPTSTR